MSTTTKVTLGAAAMLMAGTALAMAADQTISWIYCGDTIDPIHQKYITEWESKNPGWSVKPRAGRLGPVPG